MHSVLELVALMGLYKANEDLIKRVGKGDLLAIRRLDNSIEKTTSGTCEVRFH